MISVFTVGAAKLCAVVILIVTLAEGATVSKAFCKLVVIVASSVSDSFCVTAATAFRTESVDSPDSGAMLTSNLTTSLAARSDRDLPNSDNLKLSSTADVIVTSLTSTSKVVAMPVRNASRGASVNVAAVRPSSLTSDASLYVGTTSSLLEFFFNSKPRPRPNASAMTIAAATAIRRINGCARFVAMACASVARHTAVL